MKVKTLVQILAVSVVVGGGLWFALSQTSPALTPNEARARARARARELRKMQRAERIRKITEIKIDKDGNGARSVRIVQTEEERPSIVLEDEELKALTQAQRSALEELQNALDRNDFKAVQKALRKFTAQAVDGRSGVSEVPRRMRMKAVEALGWFGAKAAVDLMGYMADADEEIAEEAVNQFELALQDNEMGDRERSRILSQAMQSITDSELAERLLICLTDMRNSVKGDTIISILTTGTEQAKTVMSEQLEFYTDADIVTPDNVEEWKAKNPDDPSDEETYGGTKIGE